MHVSPVHILWAGHKWWIEYWESLSPLVMTLGTRRLEKAWRRPCHTLDVQRYNECWGRIHTSRLKFMQWHFFSLKNRYCGRTIATSPCSNCMYMWDNCWNHLAYFTLPQCYSELLLRLLMKLVKHQYKFTKSCGRLAPKTSPKPVLTCFEHYLRSRVPGLPCLPTVKHRRLIQPMKYHLCCTVDSFGFRQWPISFCHALGVITSLVQSSFLAKHEWGCNFVIVFFLPKRGWNSDISIHVFLMNSHALYIGEPLGSVYV